MTWNRVRSLMLVSGIAALVTVGCGQGSPLSSTGSIGSVVGPTALIADAEVDVAAASSISDPFSALGNGRGGNSASAGGKEKDKGKDEKKEHGTSDDDEADDADTDDDESRAPKRGDHGSLSGLVTAISATSITVRGTVATVNTATRIRHGNRALTMADIQVGDRVEVKGTTVTTTTGTTFTATEVKVEDMDHDGDDDDADEDDEDDAGAKVEGKISGLTGTCPALTFNVVSGTTTVTTTKVTTSALTKFDDVLCVALANDKVVEVKGAKQTDGSILATKVEFE